ncbi:MAG: hypothetical protein GC149_16605 [Gammaproteobacteria bacterium]|nr:hypothetical protein [Gammaproteobacteria bacterium]
MKPKFLSPAEHRAYAILEAYGSWPECWPVEERQTTRESIAHSPQLQRYQTDIADLDQRIQAEQAAALPTQAEVLNLQQRILTSLPASTTPMRADRIIKRDRFLRRWWSTPRLALALASAALIAIVIHVSPTTPPLNDTATGNQYEAWAWYDITDQDLPAANNSTTVSMTDLIDLEIGEDGG